MKSNVDTDVIIIGAGPSGIGMGVQLIRTLGTRNFEIIEKSADIGGTWLVNTYPGCGCDVASHFYSYSFEPNHDWSQKYALQPEIRAYFTGVATKYGIEKHTHFESEVKEALWNEPTGTWVVTIQDMKTYQITKRRCRVLISAVGVLSKPNKCDLPGTEVFQGKLFHSAQWDHSFDWKDKTAVVIGNGCSATQILPTMSEGDGAVKKITQFARQAHWIVERSNPKYSALFKFCMKWVPFALWAYRAKLYVEIEYRFRSFLTEKGAKIRKELTDEATMYIKKTSPERYHDFLVPKTEFGCKRRVNDADYLACLHRSNVELIYEDKVAEVTTSGIRTESGREIQADAIILANGFETAAPLFPMKIIGREGIRVQDHWDQVSGGAASSYFGTCLSNFPNFFIMMGPNSLSGHLSVVFTSECQMNFIIRVITPLLKRPVFASSSSLDIVEVTSEAEKRDMDHVQHKAKQLVWATGCTSWFIEPKTGRNTVTYPDWQYMYWMRSIFVRWGDFNYRKSSDYDLVRKESHVLGEGILTTAIGLAIGLGLWYFQNTII